MFEIIVSSYKGGKDNKGSSFGCLDSIGDLQSVEFEEIEAILSVLLFFGILFLLLLLLLLTYSKNNIHQELFVFLFKKKKRSKLFELCYSLIFKVHLIILFII